MKNILGKGEGWGVQVRILEFRCSNQPLVGYQSCPRSYNMPALTHRTSVLCVCVCAHMGSCVCVHVYVCEHAYVASLGSNI